MKKFLTTLAILGSAYAMSACSTMAPVGATANPVSVTSKVGEDCARNILFGLIPVSADHNDVYSAAIQGNITKISTVDKQWFTVIGFYNSNCTIVHGE